MVKKNPRKVRGHKLNIQPFRKECCVCSSKLVNCSGLFKEQHWQGNAPPGGPKGVKSILFLTMRILLFSFFLLLTSVLFGQNLVPNPSFEEYVDCPNSTATLQLMVVDWFSFAGSPDFFHACNNSISGYVGVPNNVAGVQEAITGDGYAGLVNFCHVEPNCREYMAVPLTVPLTVGEQYYCMFYFSQYDGGEWWNVDCSSSHVGMKFFTNPTYSEYEPLIPDNQADLDYNQIVTDTVSWIKVEGYFNADENYNWLAIGNFFDDQNTEIEIHNDWDGCYGYTYIENVCVGLSPEDCDYLVSTKESYKPNN